MTQCGVPRYSVKHYRDGFYKLVRFNRGFCPRLPNDDKVLEPDREVEGKFSQSLSRARSVVLQVGLCNHWDYFFTGTVNPSWFDRHDLDGFYKVFAQWIRDCRKKYRCKIEYCFVPERHKDGAWHLHGFVRGIPDSMIVPFVPGVHPQKLIANGFMNWGAYSQKFGFCSLAPIRDEIGAAFYITKYLTKDTGNSVSDFGRHLYYASVGLKRADPMGFIYGEYPQLDSCITTVNQFCGFGYVEESWHFWMEFFPPDEFFAPYEYPEDEIPVLTNVSFDDLQLSLFDICPYFAE